MNDIAVVAKDRTAFDIWVKTKKGEAIPHPAYLRVRIKDRTYVFVPANNFGRIRSNYFAAIQTLDKSPSPAFISMLETRIRK